MHAISTQKHGEKHFSVFSIVACETVGNSGSARHGMTLAIMVKNVAYFYCGAFIEGSKIISVMFG